MNTPHLHPAEPLTVTVDGACRATGLGRTTISEMVANGTVDSIKVGRRRLIKVASLRRLVGAE